MNIVIKLVVAGVGVLGVCGLTGTAEASSITLRNKQVLTGSTIEWREATRDYQVTNEGASRVIPEDQIAQLNIDKPADYDKAKGLVTSRQYAQALTLLDGVIKKYKKLNWDIEALKMQAQCYVEMNDPKKAAVAMDALFAAGGTMTPALQVAYWTALQKSGDTKRLQLELTRTLGTGPADLVAAAYLVRGNSFLQDGDQDAALSDYLKILTIFKGAKAVQPEALYHAAELLEKAKDPRAAEFRKILVQEYKTSEFAAKVK